jgi:prepilin-type N-terminal cleavage/methylation domain-containing protein
MWSGTGRAYKGNDMRNQSLRNRRGFSLMELFVVIVVIGLMLDVALPYLRTSTTKGAVRGAADAVTALHAVARMGAIQRGRTAKLVIPSGANTAFVVANKVTSSGVDTLGKVLNLASQFGVTITSTSDTISFSPRGIGSFSSAITIIISKSGFSDTLKVSRGGRLQR